jgi:hypothetical protein
MQDYPRVQELEDLHGITWGELVDLEPQLDQLLRKASIAGAACRDRSGAARVFAPFRNALPELIGFSGTHRGHPVLGSLGAYEVAYWKLYDTIAGLLPPPDQGGRAKAAGARVALSADLATRVATAQ